MRGSIETVEKTVTRFWSLGFFGLNETAKINNEY